MTMQKDEYYRKSCDLENLKIELERLRHVEGDNGKLRDTMRDMEGRISNLNDKLIEMERANHNQKR